MLLFSILFYQALFDFVIVFVYSLTSILITHSNTLALVVARYEFACNFKGTCLQTAELSCGCKRVFVPVFVRGLLAGPSSRWKHEEIWNLVVNQTSSSFEQSSRAIPSSLFSFKLNVVVRARTRQEEKHARYSFLFCMFAYSKEMRIIRRCFMRVWLIDALITRINYVIACHFVIKRHQVLVFLEK